jgi:hypothetical protein
MKLLEVLRIPDGVMLDDDDELGARKRKLAPAASASEVTDVFRARQANKIKRTL